MLPPQRKLASARHRAALVVTLLLTYGCDARTPTAPAPAPNRPRASATEESQLGSISFDWQAALAPVTELAQDNWILLRATGQWQVTRNPACDNQPPSWPCSSNPPFSGFWDYPGGAGPVQVAALHGAIWDVVGMRADGGGNGIGLLRTLYGSTLYAGAAVHNPEVQQYGNYGETVHSYIIDGSYTVTAARIASPIRVTESGEEADGTRTFTVEPLYGLRLITPLGWNAPPGAVNWYFFPGESVGEEPTDATLAIWVADCRYQTTCRYRPPGPGRMQVAAYVETWFAAARSDVRGKPKLLGTLAMSCRPDSLIVGNTTTCTASVNPSSSALVVQTWHFTGDSLGVSMGISGDSTSWTFRPTVCGTLNVSGTVDGVAQMATTRVEVFCNMLQSVSNDSLLNDVDVQRAMRQYWAASHPNDSIVANRREQGGIIARDNATGGLSVVPFSSNARPNLCNAKLDGADFTAIFQQGRTVIASFHTHPHDVGQPPPANCNASGAQLPGAQFGDGPSRADWNAVNSPSFPIPIYIVDFDHVHRIRPGERRTRRPHTENRSPTCN